MPVALHCLAIAIFPSIKMYCATYCKTISTEVKCGFSTAKEKEECIKSCLDCRSSNKIYCYCPSIFPPKPSAQTRAGALQSRMNKDLHQEEYAGESGPVSRNLLTKDSKSAKEDNDDTVFYVSLIVAIIIIAVCLAIFCYMRYKKRKRDGKSITSRTVEMDQVMKRNLGSHPAALNMGRRPGPPD